MAAEAQEASSNTDAPEQKNNTATSAGCTQRAKKQSRQSLTERVRASAPSNYYPVCCLPPPSWRCTPTTRCSR